MGYMADSCYRYPGIACDVPCHSYQYTFASNSQWKHFYAPGAEILQYLKNVAKRYNVMRYVKLMHRVKGARWDEEKGKWAVEVEDLVTSRVSFLSNFPRRKLMMLVGVCRRGRRLDQCRWHAEPLDYAGHSKPTRISRRASPFRELAQLGPEIRSYGQADCPHRWRFYRNSNPAPDSAKSKPCSPLHEGEPMDITCRCGRGGSIETWCHWKL